MAGPKHPRHHDEAFKRQIVQSCESGKPSREIRAGHDIARSTPRRWVQGIRDSGSTRAADNRTPGRNEPIEPGRRNRRLEMEVDVSEQAEPEDTVPELEPLPLPETTEKPAESPEETEPQPQPEEPQEKKSHSSRNSGYHRSRSHGSSSVATSYGPNFVR